MKISDDYVTQATSIVLDPRNSERVQFFLYPIDQILYFTHARFPESYRTEGLFENVQVETTRNWYSLWLR